MKIGSPQRLPHGFGPVRNRPVSDDRRSGVPYAREDAHRGAFSHRKAAYSPFTPGIAIDPAVLAHGERLFASPADLDPRGIWPNYNTPALGSAHTCDADTLERLADGVLAAHMFACGSPRTRDSEDEDKGERLIR